MRQDKFREVVEFAEKVGPVFIATADAKGLPHIAAAGKLAFVSSELLTVSGWFCPQTVANLSEGNYGIAVVTWDVRTDSGFQVLGRLKEMRELGVLDGYVANIESRTPLPQVHRELSVQVDKIIEFKHAPHSDIEKQ